MISKHMTAALIGSALLATAAIAQTPNATTNNQMNAPAATTSAGTSYHGDWRASKVIGLNVYNDSNDKLGSISELLFDKSGNIKAAVIGVGGFLGVGQHDVVVDFAKLKFVDTPVPSSTSASTSTGPAGTGMRPTTTTSTTTGTATSAPATTTTKTNPWYPDHAVFSATKDELKAMPGFKYST
jgi:sporulation protein YlmC with PRC-barrel domain